MEQEETRGDAPPTPVLVGDAAAQILNAAGFPTWFRPFAYIVSGSLFVVALTMTLALIAMTFFGGSDGRPSDTNMVIGQSVMTFIIAASVAGGVGLLIAARGVRRMRDAAKEVR